MPTGTELILADHRRVEELFDSFTASPDGTVVGEIIDALSAHDDAEHSALYPLAAAVLGDEDLVLRAAVAHSAIKAQIDRVKCLEGVPLVAAVERLRILVMSHVADEEGDLLPRLESGATPQQLDGLAARILQTKQRVG